MTVSNPAVSCAFVLPENSLLASRRPDVMRVGVVYQADGDAIVYIGRPEDTGTSAPLPGVMRIVAKLVASAAATDLSEPSHYPDAKILPVQVHIFAQEPEVEGPNADVLIDHDKEAGTWDMEVVFNGLNLSREAAHWIVDVLASTADQLDQRSAA